MWQITNVHLLRIIKMLITIAVHYSLFRSFRTESRDNYRRPEKSIGFRSLDIEDGVKRFYNKNIANLPTKMSEEDSIEVKKYFTENMHTGSGKPICSYLDQFIKKNKRTVTSKK